MGNSLPSEKLDRNNFAFWEYKMHKYLFGQGYWSYIKGAQENKPAPKDADYSIWQQAVSRVMYCFATGVNEHLLGYIREAKKPKEAWENQRKIFTGKTSTPPRVEQHLTKGHVHHKLHLEDKGAL